MSDADGTPREEVVERLAALKATVAELREEVTMVTNRDLPLLKGTVRAMTDGDIDTVEELPDAGRAISEQLARYDERLSAVERQLEMLESLGESPSSKKEKFAAILAFAANKQGHGNGKVALSPHEIKGCTGVSRRYAYELLESMAAQIDGVRMREAQQVQTGNGTKRKGKALLVDCEVAHTGDVAVNEFTTDEEVCDSA